MRSQVLAGLEISMVEEALRKSEFEDDGAAGTASVGIARWLLGIFKASV